MTTRTRSIVVWLAVVIGAAFSCFWAFWGSIEAFHEGWYYHSLWMNLALTLAQYLAPMLAFAGVTLVATAWPRIGGILYIVGAGVTMWFFRGWWTSSAVPGDRIYRLAYNGHVMPLRPQTHWGYLGLRAVRAVRP